MLRPNAPCLENLKHDPRQAICMENPLGTALVSLKVGCGGVSGNHQGGANSVSQDGGDSAIAPACWLCVYVCVGEGSRKRTVASASTTSSSLPDVRQFVFSLCVSGAFQAAAPVLKLRGSESK